MPLTPLRVLLVEDDDGDALLFTRVVAGSATSLRVERAASLDEAVDVAVRGGREALDVVLLDLGLSDSQGLTTFLRFHEAVDQIPVVVLTGMQDDDVALAAIEAGAQDYLVKDDLPHLPVGRLLAHAVERHRLQQRLREDAQTLAEKQRELVASEARFRDLVELADDVLYRLRVVPEEVVEYASPALAMVTGVPVADFYDAPGLWSSQVHPGDIDRWTDRSRLEQGHSDRLIVRWRLPDGSWAWLEDRRTPLFQDGRLVAIQGILRDVTARERTEEALREALRQEREAVEKLQSLDRMKGTFLQALSHELRTPLTVIRGFAITLDRHGAQMTDAQRAVLVERLTAASERLERLLVDLLDVDRLTRGVVPVDRRPTNVRDLVDGVLVEVAADRHAVAVECDHDLVVAIDAPKVERIVENLVRNAVKHTPAGTRVRVGVTGDADGIVLTVGDDGPGVPPELVERIFDPFEQGAPSSVHASPGTGIGLALVAKFAELHGGGAWVEPTIGGGATFVVDLPAATTEESSTESIPGPPTASRSLGRDDVRGETVVAEAVRQLLHATDVADIPGILLAAVDRLGGRTTVDELDMPATLPLDLSLGLDRPLFAAAPPGTPARAALETHLPRLVEDAQRAAERCRELARRRSRPPADATGSAVGRLRTAESAGLEDLVVGDRVVMLRFGDDDTAPQSVRRAAQVLCESLRATDRVVMTGGDELVVLLPEADDGMVEGLIDRVVAELERRQPGLVMHVGIAQVDERGGGAACRLARQGSLV